jgi:glycosyltransferase involved in cell wall biosynthesis
MVFVNLCAGLDEIGVRYRVNDYRFAKANPNLPVGIVGKPHVVDAIPWKNPILFGASLMSHPLADPTLLARRPIRRILVPGAWMREMCAPYWGDKVHSWPVGIDTDTWYPKPSSTGRADVLLYDKVRWQRPKFERELINPIINLLNSRNIRVELIRYGQYRPRQFSELLSRCRAMIFLCEHETQGLAYQQAMSCDVPVLAWDRMGSWQDPEYYPQRVDFSPVTSVPYWDSRCGERFTSASDFAAQFEIFWENAREARYNPRQFILENLTLARCARLYLQHWQQAFDTTAG